MWDVTNIEEALVAEAEEKFNANVSTLNEIASKARELSASSLDLEVDIKISRDNGESTNRTVRLREELSRYQELGDERAKQLDQLWSSWETAQADVDELSGKLHEFFERKPSSETRGMSSNREWADSEDIDIERRSKQVVEDMVACEEKFQEKLKDEETNILEAMLKCSLG
ncbi:hypothetical protein NUW58_g9929 [Xylaria curta]|uniref:Uncharacterized protein n=1 Tax=Xylaria curta TaxID=42375 RepID=A0ACC1MTT0_9PEZI|nr:hypothetical protein NUW58_g9929 [Xylaria curta]